MIQLDQLVTTLRKNKLDRKLKKQISYPVKFPGSCSNQTRQEKTIYPAKIILDQGSTIINQLRKGRTLMLRVAVLSFFLKFPIAKT